MKNSVYVGTSVDGFIARLDGGVDFLDSAAPVDSDMGYGEFMAGIDVLVMGRNTFDQVLGWMRDDGIEWPYGSKTVVVATSRPIDIPADLVKTVEASDRSPRELVRELADRGFEHGYIDGGRTVQGFLRDGLIDEITVTSVPVLIGEGISLFGTLPSDVRLSHVDTTVFDNGCVQTRWRPLPSDAS